MSQVNFHNFNSFYPELASKISASSGNVAAAVATATLVAEQGKVTHITGFLVSGSGATTALPVTVTITGINGGTLSFTYVAVAGVLVPNTPLQVNFPLPLAASAPNTNIVVSCPSLGTGNTNNTVSAWGFNA